MDDVAGVAVEALLPFRVPPSGVTRGVLDRGVTRGVLERGVASSPRLNLTSKMVNCINLKS